MFFVDDQGRQPARAWLQALDSKRRASAIAALESHLGEMGPEVVAAGLGRDHGGGLLEFEVRQERGRLRIFFHAFEGMVILLSGVEDDSPAGEEPSPRSLEIAREQLRSVVLWLERDELGRRRRS